MPFANRTTGWISLRACSEHAKRHKIVSQAALTAFVQVGAGDATVALVFNTLPVSVAVILKICSSPTRKPGRQPARSSETALSHFGFRHGSDGLNHPDRRAPAPA
jgi:hypothetical protein